MHKSQKIFLAGHRGMVGSAIARRLDALGYQALVTCTRDEVDLTDKSAVENFMARERPEVVILAAAKVGGIQANMTLPYDFLYENLMIELNVIHAALRCGVKELLFLASSCIYPAQCRQPLREEYLMTGPLEETNDGYGMAKLAGIFLCKAANKQHGTKYFAVLPCNIYGPGDAFDPSRSHLVPALLRKAISARNRSGNEIPVWGTGRARREQMHVDDCAEACVFLLEKDHNEFLVNVGTGVDHTIAEIALKCARAADIPQPSLLFDVTKPEGMRQKLLDVSLINRLGWKARFGLEEGLRDTIQRLDPSEIALW
jgi:GDP-L-fucose synthase